MLRKLNFTERARIAKDAVHITLRRIPSGELAFDASIDGDAIDAPSDARVYVEAYHGPAFMRFDYGSLRAIAAPQDRRLSEIDSTSIRFRVKVVDTRHRILAVADDIRVTERAPHDATRTPLLPVQFSPSLGQQPWRVVFESDTPVLELNNRIEGVELTAKEDMLFFGLVYPAAIRKVLTQILLVDQHAATDDADEWWALWLRWAAQFAGEAAPSSPDDAPQWIDAVVAAFCSRHCVVDRINERGGDA
jgi:hypothetical protein